MAGEVKAVVTGAGAICACGTDTDTIWDALAAGRSGIAPITRWSTSEWPVGIAGEITGVSPRTLVPDRKLHKFIRRTDMYGLFAASGAIDESGLASYRDGLDDRAAATYSDRSGIFDGSGGGAYETQYEYFPLLDAADGSTEAFGSELDSNVSPMWLLQTLPNNVLCHVGIRYGLDGVIVVGLALAGSHAVHRAERLIHVRRDHLLTDGPFEHSFHAGHLLVNVPAAPAVGDPMLA
jgi:3-oxoacyl-[acyl-carrier-protein] synthase II